MNLATALARRRPALFVVLAVLAWAHPASPQTGAFLGAPQADSRIRVQWDPALRGIVAGVDDDNRFTPLTASRTFLAGSGVALTYPRLNPLRLSATATPVNGPVPREGVLAHLRSLLFLSSVAIPSGRADTREVTETTGDRCNMPMTDARTDAATLRSLLVGSSVSIGGLIASWRQTIDDAFERGLGGPQALGLAAADISAVISQLDRQIEESVRIVSRIEMRRNAPGGGDPCDGAVRAFYDVVLLANPEGRIDQLQAARTAMTELRDALLRQYVEGPAAMKWRGSEYQLDSDLRPTRQAPVTVTIRIVRLDFEVSRPPASLQGVEEHGGSETMVIQRFARFTTDFAIASVVSSVTTPRYGTTRNNDGETVVARMPRSRASITPAFLASFVCRCKTGPLIAPMLQAGLATSDDTPALLVGGGVRLFGLPKGEAALGGGGMFAWVRDLRSLRVGDPVGGTTDIEVHLHRVNRNGYFAALQYKF